MKQAAQSLLVCFIALFFVVPTTFAARSLIISADKNSLLGEEELTITASPSGFTDGETIYIKGAFFQNGSSNYFGYTRNGDSWVKNSSSNTSQRQIKIGEWDGTLTVKNDFSDSGYKGEGDYQIKVGFYYGSASSVNWSSNSLAAALNEPDPTATLTPTPSNSPSPTHFTTSTLTPTATRFNTPTPTRTPTLTPTMIEGDVLAASSDASSSPSSQYEYLPPNIASPSAGFPVKPIIISLLFISSGFALLSGVFVWQKRQAKG